MIMERVNFSACQSSSFQQLYQWLEILWRDTEFDCVHFLSVISFLGKDVGNEWNINGDDSR